MRFVDWIVINFCLPNNIVKQFGLSNNCKIVWTVLSVMHQSIESLGGGAGTWPGNTVLLLNTA